MVGCPFTGVAPEGDNNKGVDTVGNTEELPNTPSTVTSVSCPGDNGDTSSDEDYHEENGIETDNTVPASAPQVTSGENPLGFNNNLFMDPGTGMGPFNIATPYSLTFLPSVLVASVDKFYSAED